MLKPTLSQAGPRGILALASVGLYQEELREAIHHFKYSGRPELGRPLAEMMEEVLVQLREDSAGVWAEADLLLAVPLHPSRERKRGFNQARLLARRLSRRCGIELAPAAALRRMRRTAPQSGASPAARQRNVANAFAVGRPKRIRGRRIILVDDVYTTGATMDACAARLRQAGARQVSGLTLARTLKCSSGAPLGRIEIRGWR